MFRSTLGLTCAAVFAFFNPLHAEGGRYVVTDFQQTQLEWQTVNDNVMGGVSEGGFALQDGTLLFSGATSLANNGGFSSIRSKKSNLGLEGYDGLKVRVKGDGRSYKVALRASNTGRWIAYWADFDTVQDEWLDIVVPFEDFVPTTFGRKLPGPKLNTALVNSVGFMMYDKAAGPFSLEVASIVAYSGDPSDAPQATANDIVSVAINADDFNTLVAAVQAAGLVEALQGEGPFTVLAPTDNAFTKVPVEDLLKPENAERLQQILTYHVIAGSYDLKTMLAEGTFTTLAGQQVRVDLEGGRVRIGEAGVVASDIECSNGIIHVLDAVLIPAAPEQEEATVEAPSAEKRARDLIAFAIERGVPLYNDGSPAACRAVYEVAALALLSLDGLALGEEVRSELLTSLKLDGSDQDRAWALRRALDSSLAALGAK